MVERIFIPGQDDEDVLDLRARVWGADHPHTSRAFYKWLFQDTPAGVGSGNIFERNGKVVGFAGIANRRAQLGQTQLKIAHGLDYMADPGLGGMLSGRIAHKVLITHAKHVKNLNYDCGLNYPNDNSYKMLITKRMTYSTVLEPSLFFRTVGAVAVKNKGLSRQIAPRLAGSLGGLYATARSIGRRRSAEILPAAEFDARFDDHWDRLTKDGKLRFYRDATTLNWRYAQNPLYEYQTLVALDAGAVAGFVVVSKRHLFGIDAMLICDLSVADGTRDTEHGLLDAVRSLAKRQGVRLIISQALRSSRTAQSLGRMGFLRVPQKINPKQFRMVAKSYTDVGVNGLKSDAWAFSWGDMDVI
ncbi:MAG: hypothetical protein WBC93_01850 [Sulfitobacter sp.]